MDNRPIGIFDSGIGGLTVFGEVMKALPNERLIYFGDTARVPYGSKSAETVTKFSKQITRFLIEQDVKCIIIACNTVASNCYGILSESFPSMPFIEVIGSGVDACLDDPNNKVVGVIATEGTVRSGKYEELLKQRDPDIVVYSQACPMLVPLVEEGWTHNTVAHITAEIYLQQLLNRNIDSLILGCTHYPLLQRCIQSIVKDVRIINPARTTALKAKDYLTKNNMLADPEITASLKGASDVGYSFYTFYVSDSTNKFGRICNLVLNKQYSAVKVDIDKYAP